jgi:hypothetical protein
VLREQVLIIERRINDTPRSARREGAAATAPPTDRSYRADAGDRDRRIAGHLQEPRFPDGMSGAFGCGVESAGPAGVIEQAARPCGGFLAYAGAACAVSQTIRFML